MSIPIIEPYAFYGLKTGIKGNATYITDSKILYPVGGVLALHDYSQQKQQYIPLPDKRNVFNIICVSPDKKFAAVSETGEKPCISLYDISTLERIKGLIIPFDTITATEFTSLGFTYDGKYIIAIAGDPDWMLLCYNLETSKVESSVKANNPTYPGPISQVCCNPADNAVVCVVGNGLFRLLNVSENVWRQFGWQKAEMFPVTCATWLSFDRIIAGTKDGRIFLVESGELKAIYRIPQMTEIDMKIREDAPPVTADTSLLKVDPDALAAGLEVKELLTFKRGFACACGAGTVHLFEKVPKSDHKYRKRNVYKIRGSEFLDEPSDELNVVNCLSMDVGESNLLATTQRSQIYSVRLWGPDITQTSETEFSLVGEELHHGPVIGLAMCPWKPIFITAGQLDRSLVVWNYQSECQEMRKQYTEDIFCVALHPTGLYVLIGFSEQLRLMILLINDLQTLRSFHIRGCPLCSFSTNGHLFAAVNKFNIEVYSTVSYQLMYTLRGHNGQIGSLQWTPSDSRLVSCSLEGAIYEWEVTTGERVGEVVTKSCGYNNVAVMADGKTYGVGTDGKIKEINNSVVIRGIDLIGQPLDCIVMSRSDQMMFVAAANGNLLSVNFPIIEKAVFKQYLMHNNTVTKMLMSYDDRLIVTTSVDGTVCMWRLTFTDDKHVVMDPHFKHSTEILISKPRLQGMQEEIKTHIARITELQTENDYEMRQVKAQNEQEIRRLHDGYGSTVAELQETNQTMLSEHRHQLNLLQASADEAAETNARELQRVEADFSAKLMVEYDKFRIIEKQITDMKPDFHRQLEELEASKRAALEEMRLSYESQLQAKETFIHELQEESRMEAEEHEATKQQIEDDADREMLDLSAEYEKKLRSQREHSVQLRGEIGVMRKKVASTQQAIEEYKRQVITAQSEHQKAKLTIVSLEGDIVDLKREVTERDVTIEDKEKRIRDIKKKIHELEKFKFVLSYKITELQNKMQPKDQEIDEKKSQIRGMELELESTQKSNASLSLQLHHCREKLTVTETSLSKKCQASNAWQRSVLADLDRLTALIQDPAKLKDILTRCQQKYSKDQPPVVDIVAVTDFAKQREHLEKTIESLRRQVDNQTSAYNKDREKLIQENMVLLKELNDIRVKLKEANKNISEFEYFVGMALKAEGKPRSRKDIKKHLSMAFKSREEVHQQYAHRISEAERKIEALKDETQRLVEKLIQEEARHADKGGVEFTTPHSP